MKTKITDKEIFFDFLEKKGFSIKDNFIGTFSLIPSHRISDEGNHSLIYQIFVVNFDGVDTPENELGCVTFSYSGVSRLKYHKNSYQDQILKKAFCPKTVKEAIDTFEQWKKETSKILNSWKTIL